MTLTELQQVKKDIDNNVIVSKETWLKVLELATRYAYQDLADQVCNKMKEGNE
jgi:hypothetical protein